MTVNTSRFRGNPGFLDYVRKTILLDAMIRAGTDESPEGEVLRDTMDEPWCLLDDEELCEMKAVLADLGGYVEPPFMAVSDDPVLVELRRLREVSSTMRPAELANARGGVWHAVGEHALAAEFFRMAADLEPESAIYRSAWVESRRRADAVGQPVDAMA